LGNFNGQLTDKHAADYVKKLSDEASKYGMSTGLKNAQGILSAVKDYVHFAVNEEASVSDPEADCGNYTVLVEAGKPIFHIEYATYDRLESNSAPQIKYLPEDPKNPKDREAEFLSMSPASLKSALCLKDKPELATYAENFSTVIKHKNLDGFVLYCQDELSWGITKTSPSPERPKSMECPVDGLNGYHMDTTARVKGKKHD
jgi:hypothetical protein